MGMYCDFTALPSDKIDDYINDEEFEIDEYPSCSLDKMWDGLNFILNSIQDDNVNTKLFEYVIFGEECLNPEVAEEGDFPTNYNKVETVKQLAIELQKINFEKIISGIDFNELAKAEVYPDIWTDEEDMDEIKEDLQEYFDSLVEFYQIAAENDYVVVSYIG